MTNYNVYGNIYIKERVGRVDGNILRGMDLLFESPTPPSPKIFLPTPFLPSLYSFRNFIFSISNI